MTTKLFTALSMTALFLVACGPSEAEIQAKKDQAIADSLAVEAGKIVTYTIDPVSYTHLRAHETVLDLVCRLLLEKKQTR